MKAPQKKVPLLMKFVVCLASMSPFRLISRAAGKLANSTSGLVRKSLTGFFLKKYKIDLSEAVLNVADFKTFNEFFTRKLKKGARRIDTGVKSVVSPVDGMILSFGSLKEGIIIEAKGTGSSLDELLSLPGFKQKFIDGDFIVIYLSPRDYHRIHAPVSGKIIGFHHIPGRLFPVNSFAVNNIDRLFSVNERLITYMQGDRNRLFALVKVGATNVGSIRVTYNTSIKTNLAFSRKSGEMFAKAIPIQKGDEVGWFEFGSTVVLLFEKNMVKLGDLKAGERVLMGEAIGQLK